MHVEAVARRAVTIATKIAPDEAGLVVASDWLHDIGYADELVATSFHHLDAAAYLASHDERRLRDVRCRRREVWESTRISLRQLDNRPEEETMRLPIAGRGYGMPRERDLWTSC